MSRKWKDLEPEQREWVRELLRGAWPREPKDYSSDYAVVYQWLTHALHAALRKLGEPNP